MSSTTLQDLALPGGSIIAVTGANGFIASHVADRLLSIGYLVWCTVRSPSKTRWLASNFDRAYGPRRFSLYVVPDVTKEGAFDKVVDSSDGLIHPIAITSLNPDPSHSVPQNIALTLSLARSASRSPSLKRLVYTSSSGAAASPIPGEPYVVTSETYNEKAVAVAYSGKGARRHGGRLHHLLSRQDEGQAGTLGVARRREALSFVLNSVVPNAALGKVLSPEHQGFPTAVGIVKSTWQGNMTSEIITIMVLQHRRHRPRSHRALLVPDVRSERPVAYAEPFNVNDLLAVFRKIHSDRPFPADFPSLARDKGMIVNERVTELLKRLKGGGWTTLKDSFAPLVEQYAAAERVSQQ
ncbi:Aldehyde reductase 2-like protein 3 [Colletotrichum chlorophyti]|uniref:Aldehyde reductase 2-like protein 3 n=1 Tax=Colletotrichum chlorophyti TaxID=708187 RepID=A0A1Q8RTG9_9PEZI|nr:Aldehyde reductase 2-like protein 3 [Colletotrichum chlorophyti]